MSSVAANRMACFRCSSNVSSLFDFSLPAEEGRPSYFFTLSNAKGYPLDTIGGTAVFFNGRSARSLLNKVSDPSVQFHSVDQQGDTLLMSRFSSVCQGLLLGRLGRITDKP